MEHKEYLEEMKSLWFGVELEFTGITRSQARSIVNSFFNTDDGIDDTGREWMIKYDSSIVARKKDSRGILIPADNTYKCELVTPILEYEDIPRLQKLVRALRANGAIDSEKTGLHVHVNNEGQTEETLRNLIKLMSSKENLLVKALNIPDERLNQYCKKVNRDLLSHVNRKHFRDMNDLQRVWERTSDRYKMLNYSSLFDNKGIEYRMYNSCVSNAGRLRAYICLSVALTQSAMTLTRVSSKKPSEDNERYVFRAWLNRLGLKGNEFKVVRKYLLENLSGDSAFAVPENHNRKRIE